MNEDVTWIYKVTNAGNVALSAVSVADNVPGVTPTLLAKLDGDSDALLEAGETWYYTATDADANKGAYSNTGTASGSFTDSAEHTRTVTATDDSSYFGADPQIAINKVTVGGGNEGDGIGVMPYTPVSWKYTVTNAGNVPLSSINVTDNVSGVTPVGVDLNSDGYNDGDTNKDSKLDLKETWIFQASGTAGAAGTWYNNTGTASGSYTDSAGHSSTDTATDTSSYYSLGEGYVTNSSLCDFGNQFNLIFTPSFNLGNNVYKLSDSNPGQFYYNMFWSGPTNSTTSLKIEIPYPFVTQGATPIHVYDDVLVSKNSLGLPCFEPVNELKNYQSTITLASYDITSPDGSDPDSDPDPVPDGKPDLTKYVIELTGVPTGDGSIYVNIHLDYGEEKLNFTKGTADKALAFTGNSQRDIQDATAYAFDHAFGGAPTSPATDTIYNDNVFKKLKGNAGFVKDTNTADDGSDDAFLGNVQVKVVNKASPNTILWQGQTDNDGWYYADFSAPGKASTYQVTADTNGIDGFNSGDMMKEFQLGGATKYAQTDFFGDWIGS